MTPVIVHNLAHLLVPAAFAWLIMLATMLVDLDHLLADPVFDPDRCGLGFHPLHSWPAIALYVIGLGLPWLRLVALGLVIHMALDGTDCLRLCF